MPPARRARRRPAKTAATSHGERGPAHSSEVPRPGRGHGGSPDMKAPNPFRSTPGPVRVAVAGVGNCASSLVQGVRYYRDAPVDEPVPGLMHVELAGYHVRDIEFSAAFDVDRNKVGKDLADAVFAEPNNTFVFTEVPPLGVEVRRGPTHDGLGKYLRERVEEAPDEPAD